MKVFQLLNVYSIKQGESVIGLKLEKTGRPIEINLAFISHIELVGDGEDFPFYKRVTMSDGSKFNVDLNP